MHNWFLQLKSKRYLACARCKLWWMTPEWGRTAADLPPETQFLLVEVEEGGPYAVLLPLIDTNTFRGTLRPPRWAFPFICNNQAASHNRSYIMSPGCQFERAAKLSAHLMQSGIVNHSHGQIRGPNGHSYKQPTGFSPVQHTTSCAKAIYKH